MTDTCAQEVCKDLTEEQAFSIRNSLYHSYLTEYKKLYSVIQNIPIHLDSLSLAFQHLETSRLWVKEAIIYGPFDFKVKPDISN